MPLLKVAGGSEPPNLAAAIAHHLYAGRRVKVRAVGAGAVNQAVKGCAIATNYVASRGLKLSLVPGFETIDGTDGDISSIILIVTGN
jgi:stage V sporulation protein S